MKNYVIWTNKCEDDSNATISCGKRITKSSILDRKEEP
jgi:hypothetical protein